MKKVLLFAMLFIPAILFSKTVSLDKEYIEVHLKNNAVNVLKFPFIVHKASVTTETPETFHVNSKNYSVVAVVTAEHPEAEHADMVVWSDEGDPYLIKLKTDGNEQVFSFTSNKITSTPSMKATQYETGEVESDIKNLIKSVVKTGKIPGYKKVEVKKRFLTPDLEMQKQYIFNGGKYRVEEWYIKNRTNDKLLLDYENFYTTGVLAIDIEKQELPAHKITKAWLIIDKSTLAKRGDTWQKRK